MVKGSVMRSGSDPADFNDWVSFIGTSRVKKRVSKRVSLRAMHRIRSETLGKTVGETL